MFLQQRSLSRFFVPTWLVAVLMVQVQLVYADDEAFNDPLELSGPWAFYWQQLLEPEDFAAEQLPEPSAYQPLPGSWTRLTLDGQRLPAAGFATYRLVLELETAPETLTLRVPMVYSAYRLFINGEPAAEVGRVGRGADSAVPDYGERHIHFAVPDGQLELILQVSNYSSRNAGLPRPLLLGTPQTISSRYALEMIGHATLAGGLLLLALYQLVMFIWRRGELDLLFYGLAAASWGVYTVIAGQLLSHAGWHLPIFLARQLDGLTALLTAVFYLLLLSALFPRDFPFRYLRWLLLIPAGYVLVILAAPELIRSITIGWLLYGVVGLLVLAQLWLLRPLRRGEPDTGLLLLATVTVSASALLQIYGFNGEGVKTAVASVGMLVATGLYGVVVARRSAQALNRAQAALEGGGSGEISASQVEVSSAVPAALASPIPQDEPRELLVLLLQSAVRYWELATAQPRAELAEQSGLWTVTLDGSTRKTRTLDRYLSLDTLPKRPRWGVVTRTAQFVILHLDSAEQIEALQDLLRRLELALQAEER